MNIYNPLLCGDPNVLAKRLVELFPKAEPMTPEQQAKSNQEYQEGVARYKEARYGVLPDSCYRVLDQGSFMGWYYELELDGEAVVLREEDAPYSEYAVHENRPRAEELARAEIARRHGQEAADSATFRVIWGGQL